MKLTQLERALLRTLQAYQEAGRSRGAACPQEPSAGNVRDALVQVAGFYPDEAVKNVETWLAQRADHTARLSQMLAEMRQAPQASALQTVQEPQSLVTQLNIDVVRSGPKLHGKWVLPAGTSFEDWVTKIREKDENAFYPGILQESGILEEYPGIADKVTVDTPQEFVIDFSLFNQERSKQFGDKQGANLLAIAVVEGVYLAERGKEESLFRFEGVNYVVRGEPFTTSDKGARVGAVFSGRNGVLGYDDRDVAYHNVVAGFSSNSKKS